MKPREFQELHRKYAARLEYSMLGVMKNREEAEDVTAQAFVNAYRHRKSFRGESSGYSWIHRIAFNEAINRLRRKRMLSLDRMDDQQLETLVESDPLPKALERSECCLKIRKTLRRIPVKYRRTLVGHFIRGQKVRVIARQDRIPVGTVLSRIFAGKRLLRHAVEAQHA